MYKVQEVNVISQCTTRKWKHDQTLWVFFFVIIPKNLFFIEYSWEIFYFLFLHIRCIIIEKKVFKNKLNNILRVGNKSFYNNL
jgi:hypothetical protein